MDGGYTVEMDDKMNGWIHKDAAFDAMMHWHFFFTVYSI
jgi:hypothetical protein